jgi:UDP-glucose 4-epimerase
VRRAGAAGAGVLLRLVRENPFGYDVRRRVPGTAGAKNVLGFEAATTLDEMLDEVIAWIGEAI